MKYYSTRTVGEILGIPADRLQKAIWLNKFRSPAKSPSGTFLWTDDDIQRASWALLRRAYEPQPEGQTRD